MKAISRRLDRIENQLCPPAPRPRTRFRVVVRMEDPDASVVRRRDREPSFEKATCKRTLCPDGTLWEVVHLDTIGEDGEQPTEAELNRWIGGFPIEPLRQLWRDEARAQ
jgi:hypothetical protein